MIGSFFLKRREKQLLFAGNAQGLDEKVSKCYNNATLCTALYRKLNRRGFGPEPGHICDSGEFYPRDSNEGYYSVGVFYTYGKQMPK